MAFLELNVARANEVYGMGLSRSTSFGRKRVFMSNQTMELRGDYECVAKPSLKRRCSRDSNFRGQKSMLEDLPQELLIRIICGVEHDDLKSLFLVSKAIREASLMAKESHFAYTTPRKTVGFQNAESFVEFNAPIPSRIRRHRLNVKKLCEISVALFVSGDEECRN